MTKELEKLFAKTGSQEHEKDPLVICKFFNPCGSQTWWITEFYQKDRICYGYVTGMFEDEWGTVSLDELESYRSPRFGLGIERDRNFEPKQFSEIARKNFIC